MSISLRFILLNRFCTVGHLHLLYTNLQRITSEPLLGVTTKSLVLTGAPAPFCKQHYNMLQPIIFGVGWPWSLLWFNHVWYLMVEISGVTNHLLKNGRKFRPKSSKSYWFTSNPITPPTPKKQPNLSKAFASLSLQGLGGWHNLRCVDSNTKRIRKWTIPNSIRIKLLNIFR